MSEKVSYLALDYCRPTESRLCLESIRKHTKFPHEVIFLCNGGENQQYAVDLYKAGLIDKLILRKENGGLGIGTLDLFRYCDSEYSIYFQSDQILIRDFLEDELNSLKRVLERPYIGAVSIAGNQGNGIYSERAHIVKTDFYNSIPNKSIGGAGPYHHLIWNEEVIQKYFKDNKLDFYIWEEMLVGDNGCYAVRQNPDGSKWTHRCDTKQALHLSGEIKEKYIYPKFTDEEWDFVIKNQKWPMWKIPSQELNHSFVYFKPKEKEGV